MQEQWERRYDLVTLDLAAITDLLQPAFPGRKVIATEALSGGLINTNYKVSVSGLDEAFVLRIYTRDAAACQKERDIFALISERVPVPEVVYADIEGVGFGQPYMVTRWVEGIMLKDMLAQGSSTEIGEAALAVGEVLAHIGSYTFERAGFFGRGLVVEQPMISAAEYIEACLDGRAGQRLGETVTHRLHQLVEKSAGLMNEVQSTASLVHTDFQTTNILVREDGGRWKVAAVLDWEWAHAGTSLFDIAILLRRERQLPSGFEQNFIRGFVQQGGKLPIGWKKLAKLLDLVNLCEFLNTSERRDNAVEDVKRIVIETVENWKTF